MLLASDACACADWERRPRGGRFLPSFAGLRAGDIDEETFGAAIFAGASHSGQIWDHFLGWYEQRHNANVLWVFFEDLSDRQGSHTMD